MDDNLNSYADSVIEQKSDSDVASLDSRVAALEAGGGGGGGGSFDPYIGIISMNETSGDLECDKTFSEITSAIEAGKFIMKVDVEGFIMNAYLRGYTDEAGAFMVCSGGTEGQSNFAENDMYVVMADGTVEYVIYMSN